jgi:hypothetical protein
MMLANALALGVQRRGGASWSPLDLGDNLLDMWDAEAADTLTLSGSAVSAWASVKNGYSAAQGTGSARPIYSATSFNSRPGLTYDGSDDVLIYPAQPFPGGTTPSELWLLIDITTPGATTGSKYAFSYGGTTNSDVRALRRSSTSSVNRAAAILNAVATAENSVDVAGRHVWRAVFEGDGYRIDIDGVAGTKTVTTVNAPSVQTRVVLGALQTGAANFIQGVMSLAAVTPLLSTDDAALMLAYLKTRGGIA